MMMLTAGCKYYFAATLLSGLISPIYYTYKLTRALRYEKENNSFSCAAVFDCFG